MTHDAHGRRPAAARRVAQALAEFLGRGAALARPRAVRLRPRAGDGGARRRALQEAGHARGVAVRSPTTSTREPDPGAAAAASPDVALIASARRAGEGDRRDPRPDAPQVRRPRRRRRCWTRLDELDRRLVVAPGERDRHASSRAGSRSAFTLDFEQLWTERDRRDAAASSSRGRSTWTGVERRPWFTPGFGTRCRTGSRRRSGRRSACGSARR